MTRQAPRPILGRAAGPALGRAIRGVAARPRLTIGLVNNMADSALLATERQFGELLRAASGGDDIELKLFSLERIERGDRARALMLDRYVGADRLPASGLDGLIVTGAEPRASAIDGEAYWPELAELIDWTETAGLPTVWSCLAAHAAVLRFDGVPRRPLPKKLSGVFASERVGEIRPFAKHPRLISTPHSRFNDLAEADLVGAGYQILTRSSVAGVDSFVRRGRSLGLFFQGHPEYDADTLAREYLRDVGRFTVGERPDMPAQPEDYFDGETERALAGLSVVAKDAGPELNHACARIVEAARPRQTWRASAVQTYAAWLDHLETQKARRGPQRATSRAAWAQKGARAIAGQAALSPARTRAT